MQALNDIFFREKCVFQGKTSENGIEEAIFGENLFHSRDIFHLFITRAHLSVAVPVPPAAGC